MSRSRAPFWLRQAPRLTVLLFTAPIAAGFAGTLLPAFGWLPAIGGTRPTLDPWRTLVADPAFAGALRLTLVTGFAAAVLSLALAVGACALLHGTRAARLLRAATAPVLAAPHAAVAIGAAFLLAPSGWLVRLVSPWATGWDRPPDIASVHDPAGVALVFGLLLKEVPYLLLMTLAALEQVPADRQIAVARALGYGRVGAWLRVVLPQVYPQIRLPVYAVLAYALSVVDVALVLGPGNPPTLAVLAVRWFADPDVRLYFPAAAAACLQLAIVAGAILLWRMGEAAAAHAGRAWIARGRRVSPVDAAVPAAGAAAGVLALAGLMALAGMAVWSFAARWRFPDALPGAWTAGGWARTLPRLAWPLQATATVAAAATAIALVLVLACLENEQRGAARVTRRSLWLLYTPLLVPQVAFLFGAQVLLLRTGLDGGLAAVVWSHLMFVLPYVFLSLADPWRALDPRYARTAAALGASPGRVFVAVKLPMLLRPVLVAAAVGFAVSVGQYLPTLFAGAGRVATLTTEAVTLSSGADRRVIGVYAFAQAVLPLAAFLAAVAVPALMRLRRGGER